MAQAKKISATNMVERVSKTAKAPAKAADGFQGHALATIVIDGARKKGEAEVKSRKTILADLWKFTGNAEHIAFRNDLDAAMEKIKAEAQAASMSLNDYTDSSPVANSIRTECSLWVKMSRAVEYGFTSTMIELSKPWGEISKAATAHLDSVRNSTGDTGEGVQNVGPRQRGAGRRPQSVAEKVKTFVRTNLVDEKTLAVKSDVNLAQIIGAMLLRATVQQCDEVLVEVRRIRDQKAKIEEEFKAKKEKESAKAKAEADKAAAKPAKTATTPAAPTPTASVTDEKIERAQASTGRQTYDPETQSKLRSGAVVDVKRHTRKEKAKA